MLLNNQYELSLPPCFPFSLSPLFSTFSTLTRLPCVERAERGPQRAPPHRRAAAVALQPGLGEVPREPVPAPALTAARAAVAVAV